MESFRRIVYRKSNESTTRQEIQNKLIFYDLDLLMYGASSSLMVAILETIQIIQLMSIGIGVIESGHPGMEFHLFMYKQIIPFLIGTRFGFEDLEVIILGYLCVSSLFYYAVHRKSLESEEHREMSKKTLQMGSFLSFIEMHVIYIPVAFYTGRAILCANIFKIIYGLLSIIICLTKLVIYVFSSHSFDYLSKNKQIGKLPSATIIRNCCIMLISVLSGALEQENEKFLGILLISAALFGLSVIRNECLMQHLAHSYTLKIFRSALWVWFIIECIFLAAQPFFSIILDLTSIDLVVPMMLLPIMRYIVVVNRYRVENLSMQFIYEIKHPDEAELHLQLIYSLLEPKRDTSRYFQLVKYFTLHHKNCRKLTCLCFLLKFFITERMDTRGVLKEKVKKYKSALKRISLIMYSNPESIKALRYDTLKLIDPLSNPEKDIDSDYFLNLEFTSSEVVMSSLFANYIEEAKKGFALIFLRFVCFLIYQLKNYTGALIYGYSYLRSEEYRTGTNFFRKVIIENLLDKTQRLLNKEFIDSKYWLSDKRVLDVQELCDSIRIIRCEMKRLSRLYCSFYNELSQTVISKKNLVGFSKEILELRGMIEEEFAMNFRKHHKSAYIHKLYIFYMRNFLNKSSSLLKDHKKAIELYSATLYKQENLSQILASQQDFNMFEESIIAVFVRVRDMNYTIEKCTDNAGAFFGYSTPEVIGAPIKLLMPNEIRQNHDNYICDFLNQRFTNINKAPVIRSFALTKGDKLKVISAFAKLEYYLTDDVYLGALIINDITNKSNLILTDHNGKLISHNDNAARIFDRDAFDNPYFLFMSIPSLAKYYFPETKTQIKFTGTDILKSEAKQIRMTPIVTINKQTILGLNFRGTKREFSAFIFNYNSSDVIKTKGDKSRDPLTSNFNLRRASNWDLIKKSNPLRNTPKYFQVITKMLATNRQLIAKNLSTLQKAQVSLHTYAYRGNITYKLVEVYDLKKAKEAAIRFFKIVAENLNRELLDMLFVVPKDLKKLCRY